MTYKKSDFNNCQFNPLTDQSIFDEYPRLNEIVTPDWRDEHLEQIMRYVIMVYDPKSPLIFNERDSNYRKELAFKLADITDESTMDAVSTASHSYAPDLTIEYLKLARSMEWAAICAFDFSFWESIKELKKPISGKSSKEVLESVQKKAAIKEEIEKDIKRIEALRKTLFGEDEELLTKKRRLTPEVIASGK